MKFFTGRAKKRSVRQIKTLAVQEICKNYLVEPVYEEDVVTVDQDEDEGNLFYRKARHVLLAMRVCFVVSELIKNLKTREIEEKSHKFVDNWESRLYRFEILHHN